MKLTIDTSTDTASLALVRGSEVIAESTWQCGPNHTTQLLPHLAQLLSQTGSTLQSISGIIVARGPGSYNGLRVGISSLEVEAYPHAETALAVCPVFNAGREEIATATYQMKDNEWGRLVAEHITTVEALCSQITAKTIFCGEFIASIAGQLRERLKQKAVIPPATPRRASFLAELGLKQLEAGNYDNPTTLQPLYLRQPPITQPKHRVLNRPAG